MPERLRAIIADARSLAESGKHAHAARRYYEAASKARRVGLAGELAHCLRHGAQSSLENGNSGEALAAAQEAVGIHTELEASRGLNYANSARLVALAQEAQGKVDEAHKLWADLRSIYDLHGVRDGVAECDAHLGI